MIFVIYLYDTSSFQLVCIAQEVGIPLLAVIKQKFAKYMHKELDTEKLSLLSQDIARYEQCFFESGLDQYQSTYEDYLQMCIQFGYVVLFAAVAPFASFGALINNIFAMHIDLFKVSWNIKNHLLIHFHQF